MDGNNGPTQFLHALTGLNVARLSPDYVTVEEAVLYDLPPMLRLTKERAEEIASPSDLDSGTVIRLRDRFCLEYLVTCLADSSMLRIGPFLDSDTASENLRYRILKAGIPAGEVRRIVEYCRDLPYLEEEQIGSFSALLAVADDLEAVTPEMATEESDHVPSPAHADRGDESLDTIEKRYGLERRLRNAVAKGNKEQLRKLLSSSPGRFDFSHRLPGNPVRLRKNMLVVLNTLLRLAAEKGGLHPVQIHGLSERYAMLIESSSADRDFDTLASGMIYDYCDAVRRFSLSGYSKPVSRAVNYIHQHTESRLTLPVLAAAAECNPSYLSRQFSAETGLTVTDFINRRRVEEAMWMLEDDDLMITEIALQVGYSDSNYFCRIFHRITGITPSQYRRDSLADHPDGIPVKG